MSARSPEDWRFDPKEVDVPYTPTESAGNLVGKLRADLDGRVIASSDAGYDDARTVFYRGHQERPAALVRPADTVDVALVVREAVESGVELAVRSGGHSPAGHSLSDGGIVLDLSSMRGIEIDTERRTAWVEAGATAGEYTVATGAHGLATGFGDTGSVGVGGITLSGGVGLLSRKYGLTIDSLLGAEIVTADGEIVGVDADHHPDLFWAIRGGGGNFGVVTRFHFALEPVDSVVGGMLLLPVTPEVIASFVAEAEAAPDELSTIANVAVAPPLPFLPEEVHGQLVLMALLVYAGDTAAGERVVEPFKHLAPPLADMVRPMRYPEIYDGPEPPHPFGAASRNLFVGGVDGARAATIVEQLRTATAPMAVVQLRVLGGAVARVPVEATAYAHRDRRIMLNVAAMYESPGDASAQQAWVSGAAAALGDGDGKSGAYVGFLADDDARHVRAAYPGRTWDRLVEVKARYDPDNVFHRSHNIWTGPGRRE
jgi:FAD/FMN-containing dehydrogenase